MTAIRMCATRARSTALASKTTGCTSGGPGLAWRRGVLGAAKAAQMSAVAGVRAALAAALAADRGPGRSRATPYSEPTREAHR